MTKEQRETRRGEIARLRKNGLKQDAIARIVGTTQSTVARALAGLVGEAYRQHCARGALRRSAWRTYVFRVLGTDWIKIGKTLDPEQRLASWRRAYPLGIEVLAVLGVNVEKRLHRRFAAERVNGASEFFHDRGDVRNWIAAGTPEP